MASSKRPEFCLGVSSRGLEKAAVVAEVGVRCGVGGRAFGSPKLGEKWSASAGVAMRA